MERMTAVEAVEAYLIVRGVPRPGSGGDWPVEDVEVAMVRRGHPNLGHHPPLLHSSLHHLLPQPSGLQAVWRTAVGQSSTMKRV